MIKTAFTGLKFSALLACGLLLTALQAMAQPANDACSNPALLVSGNASPTPPTPVAGNIQNAGASSPISTCSGNMGSADVWYTFVAKTAYPLIKLSGVGSNLDDGFFIQIYAVNPCVGSPAVGCVTASGAAYNFSTTTLNAGAGLTPGNAYYIRVGRTANSTNTSAGNASTWAFNIAVVDQVPSDVQVSRSYINVTKGTTGGTVDPGDILEMRATFIIKSNGADSLSFTDTLFRNGGISLVPGSIALRTNEGLVYRSDIAVKAPFTDDSTDTDAGYWRKPNGQDTVVRINFGRNATRIARGLLLNTSYPTVFGSTCIIIATYRVRVYAPYNTKISYRTGGITYRDQATGNMFNSTFSRDSLIVYQSVGLCPNAVSASNAIGVEFNGTFGAPTTGAPLRRNRGTSSFVYGYGYKPYTRGTSQNGPDDYFYAIANNTFTTTWTTLNTWAKPDVTPNHRLFNLWDITGDHTGAADPLIGNPPCDTTRPVSATNPCGYMLTINSAFRADTAFQYDVTGLCPNTYYEISAWFKNLCAKCGGDSLQRSHTQANYIPSAPGDSSGVRPNIAFDVNGTDYYTTGDMPYVGTSTGGRDVNNRWHKRGFTYLTKPGETSFRLTLRNNAPGGGGNDWALDDIAVSTCLPNMSYSPSLNPSVCQGNALTINDTIRSYFNNYTHHQWQRSTDNGVTWTNVGPLSNLPATYDPVSGAYQYVTSYTIPPASTTVPDSGNRYRVLVATTSTNVGSTSCQVTDGISIINLAVRTCTPVLASGLLSFHGIMKDGHAVLDWNTTAEQFPVNYIVQRSTDGIKFITTGVVTSNAVQQESNSYSFRDPQGITGLTYYRLLITGQSGNSRQSRIIQLNNHTATTFDITNLVNPFFSSIEFNIQSSENIRANILVTDMLGKQLNNTWQNIRAGSTPVSIPTGHLPAGMYLVTVRTSEAIITRKVTRRN